MRIPLGKGDIVALSVFGLGYIEWYAASLLRDRLHTGGLSHEGKIRDKNKLFGGWP